MVAAQRFHDPAYLRENQYQDDTNLSARITLHQRFSTNPYGWHRWVFDHLDLPASAHVLELGCGPGTLWLENRDRIQPGWHLTLTDLSPGMVDAARDRLYDIPATLHFAVVDACRIPYESAAFDLVIANHMLYHVPDIARALGEIRRVLRPGGRLLAATNGPRHFVELRTLIASVLPNADGDRFSERFNLDNGAELLTPWFAHVSRIDCGDGLDVTEVEPLLAYIRSMEDGDLNDKQLEILRARIARDIEHDGRFHISKDTGLFICETAPG